MPPVAKMHSSVPLDRLSQGDRSGTHDHYQKAFTTRLVTLIEYKWSLIASPTKGMVYYPETIYT